MTPFYIILRRNYKDYKILVKQTYADQKKEQYSVIGRNKTVVVENNRPLWLSRMVRHRMEWSFVSGQVPYQSVLGEIYEAIEQHIKSLNSNV